jgi:hypothetical protein
MLDRIHAVFVQTDNTAGNRVVAPWEVYYAREIQRHFQPSVS